jgi:peptidyl-prolyl cis-trans isomerase SurA
MLSIKKVLAASILFLVLSASVMAQPQKVVADKIVGVVADKIILQSDIFNAIDDIKRRGGTVPDDAACLVLEQALISKILMLQAEKDSLPVTEEEVEAELENRIRYFINQVGTEEALVEMAGKSIYQIKEDARESVRESKLAEAMQRKIVENVRITPNEVKAFYEKIPRDSLPFFESELEICQIVIYPKASRDLEQYIIGEMNNYRKQVESKIATFDQLAKKHSEDPGSKERGGLYEIKRGDKSWDPVFMSTAFRLKEGEISAPVKSKFGYHIITMDERRGDNAVVRHILRIPPVTEDEIKQAASRLDTVRSRIIAGTVSFNEAANKYSDDDQVKFAGPCVTGRDGSFFVTIDMLDKDMVGTISKMKVGEYSQPVAFESEGKKGVRIVHLKSRSEPHRMNLKDDYSRISQIALDEKKSMALEKWIKAKIPTYYVMVDRETLAECPQLERIVGTQKGF